MHYTEEFKQRAFQLANEIGVRKASRQLGIGSQTIYKWRQAKADKAKNIPAEFDSSTPLEEKGEPAEQNVPPALTFDLKRELDEQKALNEAIQQTLAYLIEENTALRQQCERYLQAISMISQR